MTASEIPSNAKYVIFNGQNKNQSYCKQSDNYFNYVTTTEKVYFYKVFNKDVIILDAPSFNRLTVPKANPEIYSRVNQDGEIISDEDYYDDSDYFRPEEDTSRNKAEQKFQKFVDNVIINNKLNNFTSNIAK